MLLEAEVAVSPGWVEVLIFVQQDAVDTHFNAGDLLAAVHYILNFHFFCVEFVRLVSGFGQVHHGVKRASLDRVAVRGVDLDFVAL